MPSLYAHWLLGNKSIDTFSDATKRIVNKHRLAFDIGLQGSGFLYYNNMGLNKATQQLAIELHKNPFSQTLNKFASVYLQSRDEIVLSYLYGFIGNFVLDTNIHEYINAVVANEGVNRNELKTEFDRYLAQGEGFNMFKIKTENYLICDEQTVNAITKVFSVFDNVSAEDIKKGVYDYYKFKKTIRITQRCFPFILNSAFKILKIEKLATGINLKQKMDYELFSHIIEIKSKYNIAFKMYSKLIDNFNESLDGAQLSNYFDRSF